MPLTSSQQKKRLEKLDRYSRSKEVAMAEDFAEVEELIEESIKSVVENSNDNANALLQKIATIEIPIPKDYSKDIKALADKINEPVDIKVNIKIV